MKLSQLKASNVSATNTLIRPNPKKCTPHEIYLPTRGPSFTTSNSMGNRTKYPAMQIRYVPPICSHKMPVRSIQLLLSGNYLDRGRSSHKPAVPIHGAWRLSVNEFPISRSYYRCQMQPWIMRHGSLADHIKHQIQHARA